MPPRLLSFLQSRVFLDAFADKGRFTDLLERIPISVIMVPEAPLLGAGYRAMRRIG